LEAVLATFQATAGQGLSLRPTGLEQTADRLSIQRHGDPFKFGAFKFAVGRLLVALEPPERDSVFPEAELAAIKEKTLKEVAKEQYGHSPEMEKWFIEINKTPEAYGAHQFGSLWTQLTRTNPLTEKEKELARRFPRFGEVMEHEFYGFEKARSDLGIDEPREPKS
jgi:hypothetical protein